ncbi:gas vesicle protein GvpG [Streptomyces sp. NPDC046931]
MKRSHAGGEVTEEEFDRREDELLDRLKAAMHSCGTTSDGT